MIPAFLDSSYVIALLNQGDPFHTKAQDLLGALVARRRPCVTTLAVLTELGDGFARKHRWDKIQPFLAGAFVDPLLEILSLDAALVARAVSFRNARSDKDWGLTDCISFLVMQDRGLDEALTADRHFQQAGFRALLLEPA